MMKKKFAKIILSLAAAMLLLCGCEENATNFVAGEMTSLYSAIDCGDSNNIDIRDIKGKNAKALSRCFEKIEVCGATLTVPMKMSDMPDIFTVKYSDYEQNFAGGAAIKGLQIFYGDYDVGIGQVLYGKGADPSTGQLVILYAVSNCEYTLGDGISLTMGTKELAEAFGAENAEPDRVTMLRLSDGRNITVFGSSDSIVYTRSVFISCSEEYTLPMIAGMASNYTAKRSD